MRYEIWPLDDIIMRNVYGVWHSKEESVAGRVLRNGRAIVLQSGMLCRWGGGSIKG